MASDACHEAQVRHYRTNHTPCPDKPHRKRRRPQFQRRVPAVLQQVGPAAANRHKPDGEESRKELREVRSPQLPTWSDLLRASARARRMPPAAAPEADVFPAARKAGIAWDGLCC